MPALQGLNTIGIVIVVVTDTVMTMTIFELEIRAGCVSGVYT